MVFFARGCIIRMIPILSHTKTERGFFFFVLIKEEVRAGAGSRTVIDCCSLIPVVTSKVRVG